MKAIYVRNTRGVKYADALVQGYKTIETRTRNTLASVATGEWIAVIRTGSGKPVVIGYVRLDCRGGFKVRYDQFRQLFSRHLVLEGSAFDCKPNSFKWCYETVQCKACDPYPVPANAIRHGRVWCEWEA